MVALETLPVLSYQIEDLGKVWLMLFSSVYVSEFTSVYVSEHKRTNPTELCGQTQQNATKQNTIHNKTQNNTQQNKTQD